MDSIFRIEKGFNELRHGSQTIEFDFQLTIEMKSLLNKTRIPLMTMNNPVEINDLKFNCNSSELLISNQCITSDK